MTGYPIHMSYITQVRSNDKMLEKSIKKIDFQTEIAKLFRKKLSIRIPKFQYYDASEPDTNLYQQMKIEEKMTLFVVSTEKNTEIMKYLIYNQVVYWFFFWKMQKIDRFYWFLGIFGNFCEFFEKSISRALMRKSQREFEFLVFFVGKSVQKEK